MLAQVLHALCILAVCWTSGTFEDASAFCQITCMTRHVRESAGDVLLLHPSHEAVDEAVALEVLEAGLAEVPGVVQRPDLEGDTRLLYSVFVLYVLLRTINSTYRSISFNYSKHQQSRGQKATYGAMHIVCIRQVTQTRCAQERGAYDADFPG